MIAGPLLPPGLRGHVARRHLTLLARMRPTVPDEARRGTTPDGTGATPGAVPGASGNAGANATANATAASIPGTRLAVASIGPPDAPAWLIAPGAGSSALVVASMFAHPVQQAGGRLVTYDLRGHGASSPARDPAEHHLDVVAGDLAAVAGSIDGGIEVIGGISLGGHAAVRAWSGGLIGARPAAVLACLPAFDGPVPVGQGIHAAIAAMVRSSGVDGLLEGARRAPEMPRWLRTAVLRDQARHDAASLAAALQALDGADAPADAERWALDVPLAVVGWPDDPGHPLAVAQRWVATTRQAALVTIAMDELEAGLDVLGRAGLEAVDRALGSGLPR